MTAQSQQDRLSALYAELRAIEGTSVDAAPVLQKIMDLSWQLGRAVEIGGTAHIDRNSIVCGGGSNG